MWKCSIFLNEVLKTVKTIHFDRYILPQFKKLKDERGKDRRTEDRGMEGETGIRETEWNSTGVTVKYPTQENL